MLFQKFPIPSLRFRSQKDCKLQTSLDCIVRPYFKKEGRGSEGEMEGWRDKEMEGRRGGGEEGRRGGGVEGRRAGGEEGWRGRISLPHTVTLNNLSLHLVAFIYSLFFPPSFHPSPPTPGLVCCLLVLSPSTRFYLSFPAAQGVGLGDGFPALQGDGQSSSVASGSLRSGVFKKQSLLQ